MNDFLIMEGFNSIAEFMKTQNAINEEVAKRLRKTKRLNSKLFMLECAVCLIGYSIYNQQKKINVLSKEVEEFKDIKETDTYFDESEGV